MSSLEPQEKCCLSQDFLTVTAVTTFKSTKTKTTIPDKLLINSVLQKCKTYYLHIVRKYIIFDGVITINSFSRHL